MNYEEIGTKGFYTEIGNRVKEIRISRELTQEALANTVNITQNHYGKIENGIHSPSLVTLSKICKVLNCDMNYIVYGEITTSLEFLDIIDLNKYDQDTIKEVVKTLVQRMKKGEHCASDTIV